MKKGIIGMVALSTTLATSQLGCYRNPSERDIENIKLSQLSEMKKIVDSSGESQQIDKTILLQKIQQEEQKIDQKRKKRTKNDEANALGLIAAFGVIIGLVTVNSMMLKTKNKAPQKGFEGNLHRERTL